MDIHTIISSLENAENDNKRFALLLILAELIKSNKLDTLKLDSAKSDDESRLKCKLLNEKLFSSINPHFLARLLATRQTTENFSPTVYKAVALSIITQFLDYESLVCDPVLISKLDVVCEVLVVSNKDAKNTSSDTADETTNALMERNLCADAFKYLFALSRYIPDHLCQSTNLLDILMSKIILNEEYRYSVTSIESLLSTAHQDEANLQLIACKLFASLCRSEKPTQENAENMSKK